MRSSAMVVLLSMAMAVSACGSSSDGDATTITASPVTTDPAAQPTTDTASPVTTTAPSPATPSTSPATVQFEDVPYFDDAPGLNTPVLDVFMPSGDGPWPIVVTFHPDSAQHTKSATEVLARAIAERGAVVVNPTYGGPGITGDRTADIFRTAVEQSTCAVWFAIEHATEYGGDVDDIRLVGFSGGANMATAVAMFPSTDDRHCLAPAVDINVSEVVAFEGDFTLGAGWTGVIRDDPEFYEEMTVWSHIADYAGGPIHVLVDSKTSISITRVEDYLDVRHPDGPIRDAWEAMGVIEADRATFVQANELFHDLLVEAGHVSTLTTIEAADHSLSGTARAAIIDLLFGDADG